MSGKNKFGFDPLGNAAPSSPRRREVGPMGAAVREAASSLSESTESLVEQRRRNAADAKAFRQARDEGRVLVRIALDRVDTDNLPRDRLDLETVAGSDEMEELKASMRERGQKEPIEVFRDGDVFQLKKGWRRLTALRQLAQETGDPRFSEVVARVAEGSVSRIDLYIDMVEENVIREDLSFAEMAQVAITAAQDAGMEGQGADALVGRLYASLHKMKRSYIRSFVHLLEAMGPSLPYPKAIPRNLGVEVARRLHADPELAATLRAELSNAISPESQNEILRRSLEARDRTSETVRPPRRKERVKYEFHVGSTKVTARRGECRILSERDFSSVDRSRLKRAIELFEEVLDEGRDA